MSFALNRTLLRLGRWPRRLAVVVCVLLGLSDAMTSHGGSAGAAPDPLARLGPGQVAVPVTLTKNGVDGVLAAGQRVGLLSEAGMVADHLLLLRVSNKSTGADGTSNILVAADRATALRIAQASPVLAVVDKSP